MLQGFAPAVSLVAYSTAAVPEEPPMRVTIIDMEPTASLALKVVAPSCIVDGAEIGCQSGNQSSTELVVSIVRLLPSAFITKSSTVVSSATLPEAKTIFEPSDDQAGKPSVTALVVSRVLLLPSAFIKKISTPLGFMASPLANKIFVPFGEKDGWPSAIVLFVSRVRLLPSA